MKTLLLFCVVNIFLICQIGNAQNLNSTVEKPTIHYVYVFNVTDSTFDSYTPSIDISETYTYNNKTIFKTLDGSTKIPNKESIETHGGYKFSTFQLKNSSNLDTLEQVFLIGNQFRNLELNFGIINTISEHSDLKKLNNTEYILSTYKNTSNPNSEEEFSHNWFVKNIGSYIIFGYSRILVNDKQVYIRRSLSNKIVENFTGKVSTINGKEFRVFGKSIYVSPSTKLYDFSGKPLSLEDVSENDRFDIDFIHYNTEGQGDFFITTNINKYIALRITKLPQKEEVNRYSEDVIKVSNDTIYTTSHFLKLSSVQSKKDVNGDEIETDSLFAHYRAITFEVPSNEDRNEIRNVDFLHSTFNQKDSLHYRGTAIGRINSIQFPNITLGKNNYLVATAAKIRNKFGDSTIANEANIPKNSLVKIFYSKVESGNNVEYLVNFIALEDTSTFTTVNEPKERLFTVFPNPITTNQTTIEYFSEVDEMIQLNIISLDGKLILKQNLNVNFGNNTINTNVKSIPNGHYFLEMSSTKNKKQQITQIQILR